MTQVLQAIGKQAQAFVDYLGRIFLLVTATLASCVKGKLLWRNVLQQISVIGFSSQLVVIVTGAFTGAVLTAQTYFQFSTIGLETAIGGVVSVALCRELGPVLTGLMLAGRVGASISAEIGSMKVSEQIDALRSLAIHPIDYLVAPRAIAMLFSIPLLILESVFFGVIASWFVAVVMYNVDNALFWKHLNYYNGPINLAYPFVKGAIFGQIIVFIACLQGLETKGGAVGLGKNITKTVVISSLSVLIFNFFLSLLLNLWIRAGFYQS